MQNYARVNIPCSNKQKISDAPQVILPDVSIMTATNRALLNLKPLLTQAARTSQIYPHLQSGALVSIGQLWDGGCTETFTNTHLSVVKDRLTILEGINSSTSGMCQVNLTSNTTLPPMQKQSVALNNLAERSKPGLSKWYHASLFTPVKKKLLQSIKNLHFNTWSSMTV